MCRDQYLKNPKTLHLDTLIFDMRLIGHFLRLYSYVFEAGLCAAGLLLGGFALASSNMDVRVPWLPWTGTAQIRWIISLSLAGLVCVALAAFGMLRTMLFLFSAVVAGLLIRGFFISSQYTFSGQGDVHSALLLVLAALLALIGAYPGFGKRRRRV